MTDIEKIIWSLKASWIKRFLQSENKSCGSLLFLLSVFILWFSYYVSDIFCKF